MHVCACVCFFFPGIEQMMFQACPLEEKQKWHYGDASEGEWDLRVRVTHLSWDCHQTSMPSPLLLLGRSPSLPPCLPLSLPSCFTSSHPGLPKKDSILGLPICPLRRGLGRKIWANPSVPLVLKKHCATTSNQCHDRDLQWWQANPEIVEICMKWKKGALMGWPQTPRCCVLSWYY